MTKAQHISNEILKAHLNRGLSLKEAFDLILGAGMYEKLVNDLYHGLRKEVA